MVYLEPGDKDAIITGGAGKRAGAFPAAERRAQDEVLLRFCRWTMDGKATLSDGPRPSRAESGALLEITVYLYVQVFRSTQESTHLPVLCTCTTRSPAGPPASRVAPAISSLVLCSVAIWILGRGTLIQRGTAPRKRLSSPAAALENTQPLGLGILSFAAAVGAIYLYCVAFVNK